MSDKTNMTWLCNIIIRITSFNTQTMSSKAFSRFSRLSTQPTQSSACYLSSEWVPLRVDCLALGFSLVCLS